jgi:protein-arginine kinase activator protein McsA
MDKKCFVCEKTFNIELLHLNANVNLYVCNQCAGTKAEKEKETDLLDGLADGFVCGCI